MRITISSFRSLFCLFLAVLLLAPILNASARDSEFEKSLDDVFRDMVVLI